jgi:hypothetical protein
MLAAPAITVRLSGVMVLSLDLTSRSTQGGGRDVQPAFAQKFVIVRIGGLESVNQICVTSR